MLKLTILVSFLCAVSAVNFNCLKGPSYWCSSLEKAKECGRVTECYVQNKFNKPIEKSEACSVCAQAVTYIQKSIVKKLSEAEFIAIIDGNVCKLLPPHLRKGCDVIVNTFGAMLYAELKNGKPQDICKLVHMCSGTNLKHLIERKHNGSEACAVCKKVIGEAQVLFSKITPEEFGNIFKAIMCGQMPSSVKELCNQLVDGYSAQIYELLKSLLDANRTCEALHLCSSSQKSVSMKLGSWQCQTCLDVVVVLRKDMKSASNAEVEGYIKTAVCNKLNVLARSICNSKVTDMVPQFMVKIRSTQTPQIICHSYAVCAAPPTAVVQHSHDVKESLECEVCEMAIDKLKTYALNEQHKEEIVNFIKTQICSKTGSYQAKCKTMVDTYAEIVMKMLNEELTSQVICKALKLCSAAQKLKITSGTMQCELCHLVFTKIKKTLADPTSQAEIKDFLKNRVCSIMGKEAQQCQQIVDEFFTIIMNTVIAKLDVDELCVMLKACSAKMMELRVPNKPVKSVRCDVCEALMTDAVEMLTTKVVEKEVGQFVIDKMCVHLGFAKTECTVAVDTYLPYLFRIAHESLNSKLICAELHLCRVPALRKIYRLMQHKEYRTSTYKCDLCQFIVNETKTLLSNSDIQADVLTFLKNTVCVHFGTNKDKCVQDVNEYYSLVINLVIQFLNPSLCSDIDLCSARKSLTSQQQKIVVTPQTLGIKCNVCQKFYDYLKKNNAKKASPSTILLGLVQLCSGIPQHHKGRCLNEIKDLLSREALYEKSTSQNQFCEVANKCRKTLVPTVLVGGNRCSWGPAYWCQNKETARLCGPGAMKHCEMRVWVN